MFFRKPFYGQVLNDRPFAAGVTLKECPYFSRLICFVAAAAAAVVMLSCRAVLRFSALMMQ